MDGSSPESQEAQQSPTEASRNFIGSWEMYLQGGTIMTTLGGVMVGNALATGQPETLIAGAAAAVLGMTAALGGGYAGRRR